MRINKGALLVFIGVVAVNLTLSGCGGAEAAVDNNAPSDPGTPTPSPAAIEGVATPSSVAVVTATKAD